jgi:uncharacterized protein YjiS (DUF1127 family)
MSIQSALYREKAFARAETRQPPWIGIFEIILELQRRARSRRELARLSYLDIKDIGYPAAIEAEKKQAILEGMNASRHK